METTNWLTAGIPNTQLQTEKWEALLSAAIELKMKEHNMTYADLANKLNKSKCYVKKILSGKYNFKVSELVEICDCFDCDLSVKFMRKKK